MRHKRIATVFLVCLLVAGWFPSIGHAADIPNDFNLQVTPSPIVATVQPGSKTQVELKIRNAGSGSEQLKIEPRAFSLSSDGESVKLQDTTPPDIASWISFSQPKFTIASGAWFSEEITFNVPKDAGFSYSFALVVSRQSLPKAVDGSRVITGSLAIFTLINVDRPGATSNLTVSNFSVSKKVYEYLPSNFTVRFRNVGNTIVQPYGNIFIQRGKSAATPLATLVVNENKGYVLPGTERVISTTWNDGFPVYKTVTRPDGTTTQQLVWNWGQLSKLRIGQYTAHLVAVYNQNGHDVPIEGTVSFWVIPWKLLLGLLSIGLLLLFALYTILHAFIRMIRRRIKPTVRRQYSKDTDTDKNIL